MYTPKIFAVNNLSKLHGFIKEFPFCTLVSNCSGIMRVSHVPLTLYPEDSAKGTLRGHLAVGNDQLKDFEDDDCVVQCIFSGPHSYISPRFYNAGRTVPTWNYTVTHAIGKPALIDRDRLLQQIKDMAAESESELADPKSEFHLSDAYISKQLSAIRGFEIPIDAIFGKFKLGQNRPREQQASLHRSLKSSLLPGANSLARFMAQQHFEPEEPGLRAKL